MRIPEGLFHPFIIVLGWIGMILLLGFISFRSKYSNKELSTLASFGAFIFVIQLVPIPINLLVPMPFPVWLTLSGVSVAVLILGTRKGLLVSSAAIILNHIFIPGAFSNLGLSITNTIIIGLGVGYPLRGFYLVLKNKKYRLLVSFLTGFAFVSIEGILIILEFWLAHKAEVNILPWVLIAYLSILSLLEGIFTAITVHYYYESKTKKISYLDYDSEDELESIEFIEDNYPSFDEEIDDDDLDQIFEE